jgi:hypothetical protein
LQNVLQAWSEEDLGRIAMCLAALPGRSRPRSWWNFGGKRASGGMPDYMGAVSSSGCSSKTWRCGAVPSTTLLPAEQLQRGRVSGIAAHTSTVAASPTAAIARKAVSLPNRSAVKPARPAAIFFRWTA